MVMDEGCVLTIDRWLRLQLSCLNGLMAQSEASSVYEEEGWRGMLLGYLCSFYDCFHRLLAKVMHSEHYHSVSCTVLTTRHIHRANDGQIPTLVASVN